MSRTLPFVAGDGVIAVIGGGDSVIIKVNFLCRTRMRTPTNSGNVPHSVKIKTNKLTDETTTKKLH